LKWFADEKSMHSLKDIHLENFTLFDEEGTEIAGEEEPKTQHCIIGKKCSKEELKEILCKSNLLVDCEMLPVLKRYLLEQENEEFSKGGDFWVENLQETEDYCLCGETFQDQGIYILSECGHKICPECAKSWSKQKDTCPNCRGKAGFGEPFYSIRPADAEKNKTPEEALTEEDVGAFEMRDMASLL
jgi:hypothetical protein